MVGVQKVWLGKRILGHGVRQWSAPVCFHGGRLARKSLGSSEGGLKISQDLAYRAGVLLV